MGTRPIVAPIHTIGDPFGVNKFGQGPTGGEFGNFGAFSGGRLILN